MEFDPSRLAALCGFDENDAGSNLVTESSDIRVKEEEMTEMSEMTIRKVIRREVELLVKELREKDGDSGASWIYGNKKPIRSAKGQVTMGAFGIGFGDRTK